VSRTTKGPADAGPPLPTSFAARFVAASRAPGARSQILFIVIAAIVVVIIWQTASQNLSRLSVKSGFGFLLDSAPFELGETPIRYSAGDSYLRAFVAGTLNTLKVATLGIVLSTFLGLLIALGQLSKSVALSRICRGYLEVVRNVPLLLQLIFWHTFLTRSLPNVREALSPIEGIYVTNRGFYLPAPVADPAFVWVASTALLSLFAALALRAHDKRVHRSTGVLPPRWRILALFAVPPLLVFLALGAPLSFEQPAFKGFNFRGGMEISPEFAAMLLGLTIYTAAFNAEIIRAGILGVPKGQTEAGYALGLLPGQVTRKIVLPQALRIIIPPMSNSYLNLTKESSLAVAIGYPEVVRVANITLAETSQAIECVAIIMIIYLTLSLTTAGFLNWVNARAALVER
jgi:general L-amino acid transport system permease protein